MRTKTGPDGAFSFDRLIESVGGTIHARLFVEDCTGTGIPTWVAAQTAEARAFTGGGDLVAHRHAAARGVVVSRTGDLLGDVCVDANPSENPFDGRPRFSMRSGAADGRFGPIDGLLPGVVSSVEAWACRDGQRRGQLPVSSFRSVALSRGVIAEVTVVIDLDPCATGGGIPDQFGPIAAVCH